MFEIDEDPELDDFDFDQYEKEQDEYFRQLALSSCRCGAYQQTEHGELFLVADCCCGDFYDN